VTHTVGDVTYTLHAEPVRQSLSDDVPMLWGFPVQVEADGKVICTKTCFVGRVSVHTRDPEAADGPSDKLFPLLHELALERVVARLDARELDDEIVFA